MIVSEILAATLTVAFEGLMLFQTEANGGKHVAIVEDAMHNPGMEICHRDMSNKIDVTKCVPISFQKDDIVTFDYRPSDVGSLKVKERKDRLYTKHVPKIREFIVNGKVRDDVVNEKTPNAGVLAFVNVPPGKLSTFRTFDEQVDLTKNNHDHVKICFARFVVLETTISNPALLVVHHRNAPVPGRPVPSPPIQPYPLNPGDLVFVSNTSDDTSSHFHIYKTLLTNGGKLGAVTVLKPNGTCRNTDGEKTFDPVIEAALAAHRSPIGDCGPSGP